MKIVLDKGAEQTDNNYLECGNSSEYDGDINSKTAK
jgi:hypothetical protein